MNWRKWFFVGFLITWLLAVSFLTSDLVFAQELIPGVIKAEYDLWGMQAFAESSERRLRVVYLIMRPMLALAWAAMDNSLVYGEAFFLTPALFKFWNIIRTFANFTLWFYFMWKILSAFFNNKLESWYFSLIKKAFIAWVLINFSWSIIASMIDISTIATVSLWGIPIHALQSDATFKDNVYYLKTHANLNQNDANSEKADRFDFSVIYSCYPGANRSATWGVAEWDKQWWSTWGTATKDTLYYIMCGIEDQKLLKSGDPKETKTRENRKQNFVSVWKADTKIDTNKIQDDYCVYNNKLIKNTYGANIGECKVLQDLMVKWKVYWVNQCAQINDLITRSRYYTGPLFAMYTSIINVADMWVTSTSWSLKQIGLTLMLKLITIWALLVPLIAFAVVMLIRVIYLWMIIIFSPMIVLVMTLERWDAVSWKIDSSIKNMFNVSEVVKLILLPAITTFALSISIIFLTLLHNLPLIEESVWASDKAVKTTDGCRNDTITAFWNNRTDTPEWTMYDFGAFEINLAESLRRTWADIWNILSRLWLNGLWIALMRMVVFAALKSSEFTKWVVDTIESTAKSMAWAVPIIPLGNWKSVWIDALKEAPGQIKNKLVGAAQDDQRNIINDTIAKNFGWDVWKINNNFEEAAKTPTGVTSNIEAWINKAAIAPWTDFTDYKAAPQTYAKQAQTWFDKQPDPNNPGKNLWDDSNIKNSLAGIKTWEDALQNPYFVQNMHDNPDNKVWDKSWYDNFLTTWDQRSSKDEKWANFLENWMKKMKWATPLQNKTNKYITWYQYLNKITLFERDPVTGKLLGNKTQSRTIDSNITDAKDIKKEDVTVYNTLIEKNFELPDSLPLFKILNTKTDINIKDWKITRKADWKWYNLPISATPATTTPATNNNP